MLAFLPLLLVVSSASVPAQDSTAPRPLVAVLNLEANPGATEQAPGMTALVASGLASNDKVRVISQTDVSTALGLERTRQLLSGGSCSSSECLVELSGAVGARFIVFGRLDRFGDRYVLTATLFDSQKAVSLAKPRAEAGSETELPGAARTLTSALLVAPELGAGEDVLEQVGRFSLGLRLGTGFVANLVALTPGGDLELSYQLTRAWAPFLQVGFSLLRGVEGGQEAGISLLPSALGVRHFYSVEHPVQPYWGLGLGLQLSFGTYGPLQQTGPLPTVLGLGGVRWKATPALSLQLEGGTDLARMILGVAQGGLGNGLNLELSGGVGYTF
ncbi:MAG: hypothetical protein L0Y66_20720 [Myxococcaceae bacterium]|nr:hypothetical protein [Myxococcaceae bacterium]MCI0669390.1 hypothetical protein [Myxococcaceae bacterium]